MALRVVIPFKFMLYLYFLAVECHKTRGDSGGAARSAKHETDRYFFCVWLLGLETITFKHPTN